MSDLLERIDFLTEVAVEFRMADLANILLECKAKIQELDAENGRLTNNVMVFRDEKNLAIKRWSDLLQENERLKAENVVLQSGARTYGFAADGYDESANQSLDDAVDDVFNNDSLQVGNEIDIRQWLWIDLPDIKVRVTNEDGDYEVLPQSPKEQS